MLKLGGKYDEVLDPKNNEFHCKYNMSDLVFSDYDYDNYFVPPLEDDKNVSSMPPLEGYKKHCLCTNHVISRRTSKRERIKSLKSKETIN